MTISRYLFPFIVFPFLCGVVFLSVSGSLIHIKVVVLIELLLSGILFALAHMFQKSTRSLLILLFLSVLLVSFVHLSLFSWIVGKFDAFSGSIVLMERFLTTFIGFSMLCAVMHIVLKAVAVIQSFRQKSR